MPLHGLVPVAVFPVGHLRHPAELAPNPISSGTGGRSPLRSGSVLNLSVPGPSWGQIVNEGRAFLDSKPVMSISAGIAITVVVLSFNVLGDATRDWLGPRQRTR